MRYEKTTQVPNYILDILLSQLKEKELKVLLVIVRQTYGWIGKNGKRKSRDWITQTFFMKKTGLSNKSVSLAIQELSVRKIIVCTDRKQKTLYQKAQRRGKEKIYYALAPELATIIHKSCEQSSLTPVRNTHNTKLISTKLKKFLNEKGKHNQLSDRERYLQIISESE